jgi:uncharacterized protein (TIGR03083 family)
MLTEDHLSALANEGRGFITAVAAADLDATVPSCPNWSVRELAQHLGRVHRWAEAFVRERRPEVTTPEQDEQTWGVMPADPDLVGWLRQGHDRLVTTLTEAPRDVACWSFLPAPSPLAFWARRQAHETAVHRVDAQQVAGPVDPVDPAFAVDGIDELLLGFYSRKRNQLRHPTEKRVAVRATDAPVAWIVQIGPDGARAERRDEPGDVTITGPAADLYLALWNRVPFSRLDSTGDPDVLELWSERAHVVWA